MANIKDIARLSGVAPSTVSAVLTGRTDRVKPSTRERVIEVMRELRYVPSPLFYGTHAETTTTIGVVFFASYEPDDEDMDPYYMSILAGIMAVGIRRGCNVICMPVRNWDNSDRTLRVYFDGRCDGLLLLNPKGSEKIVTALRERNYPFVLVNSERDDPLCNCVGIDLVLGATMSMEHLLGFGHRRIALLAGNGDVDTRAETYAAMLTKHGIAAEPDLMPKGSFAPESSYKRTVALMTSKVASPTALFCDTDQIALGALQALRDLDIRVPEEVSVIGFDDVVLPHPCEPPLTTVRRPLLDIGKEASKLLLRQMSDITGAPERIILPAELIIRATTGPAPIQERS